VIGLIEGDPSLQQEASDWVERAKLENPFGDLPPLSIETFPHAEDADAFLNGCSHPIADIDVTPDMLHEIYKEQVGEENIADYEKEVIVNNYDINIIRELRKLTCDDNFHGSTRINTFHAYVDLCLFNKDRSFSILDVGCGAGSLYGLILQFCRKKRLVPPTYIGIDYGRSQVLRAQRNYPNGFFKFGTASMLRFHDNSIDYIIANSVLPYIPTEDQIKAISEIFRVSKNGAFFSTMVAESQYGFPSPEVLPETAFTGFSGPLTKVYYPPWREVSLIIEGHDKVVVRKQHFFILVGENNKIIHISNETSPDEYANIVGRVSELKQRNDSGGGNIYLNIGANKEALYVFEGMQIDVFPRDWFNARFDQLDAKADMYQYFD